MNIALSFHKGDRDQAIRWLNWCAELGGVTKHRLFIMAGGDSGNPPDGPWRAAWASVDYVADSYRIQSDWSASNSMQRDASGPNSAFRQFAWHFHMSKLGPWTFMEPDCTPLVPEWADRWEAEYLRGGKPFMGGFVNFLNGSKVQDHMTGIAVYPESTAVFASLMVPKRFVLENRPLELAFDVAGAPETLRAAHITTLIEHVFRGPLFPEAKDLERISVDAVMWHTDKDGSLVDRLREKRNGTAVVTIQPTVESVEPTVTNVVRTYFSPCQSPDALAEQHKLLELWRKTWEANGWTCKVLTIEDAQRHSRFAEFEAGFKKLPMKNHWQYEGACFLRWVAMAANGGGLMTDYDVMNNDCVPMVSPNDGKIRLFCGHVPCMVFGSANEYENCAVAFIQQNAQSDMHFYKDRPSCAVMTDEVSEYPKSSTLIHFSHHACNPRKRSECIEEWMKNKVSKEIQTAIIKECVRVRKYKKRKAAKPQRTAEQQAKIDARMAKARAARKAKA